MMQRTGGAATGKPALPRRRHTDFMPVSLFQTVRSVANITLMMNIRPVRPLGLVTAILLGALLPPVSVAGANGGAPVLRVMTYNLRYASPKPPNAWPDRRPLMRELLLAAAPDVVGTQEGVYAQLKDLAADLPGYDWIGLGRDGGSRGEFMAVFFRKERLEPVAFDHFWLSDTPEVMASSTWGANHRRMVTWVRFRDRSTGQEFFLLNTHFDHQVQVAREKSAALVRQRVVALDAKVPVLLIGDFNAAAGANRAYALLTEGGFFTDLWLAARERVGEGISTFNNFKAVEHGGVRIDWILARGGVEAERIEVLTFQRDGQFPSDHFPVLATVRLGPRP
jgi:endonuclease/exonuclease/phosphatase family metal-dependent hydrolase